MQSSQTVDVQNARTRARGDYAARLAQIEASGDCPFCQENLGKYHPKPIIFANEHWLVTENAWPYEGTRHQFVLICRRHIEAAEHLPAGGWEALGEAHRRLVAEYRLDGGTLLLRSGQTDFTGASVAHLHAQLICGSRRRAESELVRALVAFKQSS